MAKIENIVPDQTLWDYHRYQMGNTTMKKMGEWRVKVIEVDLEERKALCSWNGNPPKWFSERSISKWKVNRRKMEENKW